MFIYESRKMNEAATAEVEVLNIKVSEKNQIPGEPDVEVWKDGDTVYAKIGDNVISGDVE